MKVVQIKVGKEPEVIEARNELEDLQALVGGYIETVSVADGILLIVNEEGKIDGLPYNFSLVDPSVLDMIVGDVFFVADKDFEFTSLSDKQIEAIKKSFMVDGFKRYFHVGWLEKALKE